MLWILPLRFAMRELSSEKRIVYRPKAIDKDQETAMVHCTEATSLTIV
jgi:hypothetical protein